MKKSLFVSLFALMVLGACAPAMPEELLISIGLSTSPQESSVSPEEEKGPKDELFKADDTKRHPDGGYLVTIPEYKDPLWLYSSKGTSTIDSIKFGTSIITNALYNSWEFFATDINKDGYREIVFFEKDEQRNKNFHVYDLKNGRTILKQKEMTLEKFNRYYGYRYNLDIRDNHVVFLPYIGNFSESTIIDYGHLRWSEDKGAYFEWENIYKVKQIVFDGIYVKGSDTPVLTDGYAANLWDETIWYYNLELNTRYYLKYTVIRGDYTLNFNENFLEVYWDNEHSTYFQECSVPTSECHPETGKYAFEFTMRETGPERRTWNWFYGSWGFDVVYRVMQQD